MMRSTLRSILMMFASLGLCAAVVLAQPDADPGGTTGDDTLLPSSGPPRNDGTGGRMDQQFLETPQVVPALVYDTCLSERSIFNTYTNSTVNCTANDVTFTSIGRGVEANPCVRSSNTPGVTADTAELFIRAQIQTTTSQQRYDVGFFLATPLDPTPADGAQTGDVPGACGFSRLPNPANEGLLNCDQSVGSPPINGETYLDLHGAFDDNELQGSAGYYFNFDNLDNMAPVNDLCAEVINTAANCDGPDPDTVSDSQVVDFDWAPHPVVCLDQNSDGFLEIPGCASWSQNNTEIDGNDGDDFCESSWDLGAAAPSKCFCGFIVTGFPAPNLTCREPGGLGNNILCTVPDGMGGDVDVTTLPFVPAGATVTCSVEVRNDLTLSDPTCVDATIDGDPLIPGPDDERGRCGHIGYLEWDVLVDASTGTQPTIVNESSTDGQDELIPLGNTLLWRTRSDSTETPDAPLTGTLGVIRPNETTELTFQFVVPAGDSGRTFDITMEGLWHAASDFSDAGESEDGLLTCSSMFTATPVTLAHAGVRGFDGEQVLQWTTATETSNVGFNVLAATPDGVIQVNDELIESQAVSSTSPLEYSFDVSGVDSGRFWIEEIDAKGKAKAHGPFRLGRSYGRRPEIETIDWAGVRDVTLGRGSRRGLRVGAEAKRNVDASGSSAGPAALLVQADGIHRVSHEELVAAGFDFGGTQTSALALLHRGQPVPIHVLGPSKFGPGSSIEFFGEGIDSLYTDDNVYVLANDRRSAVRVSAEDATPGEAPQPFVVTSVIRQNDVIYNPSSPTDDPWFETRILARQAQTRSYDFTIDGLVPGGAPATVAVDVWGESQWPVDDDHHVVVSINGFEVADVRWDGLVGERIQATIPDGVLQDGANTLSLSVPADNGQLWDLVNFDGFEVRYPAAVEVRNGALLFTAEGGAYSVGGISAGAVSAYRIGDSGAVLLNGAQVSGGRITFGTIPGERYAVVSGGGVEVAGFGSARPATDLLKGPSFDYLIVSHSSFIDGLAPLVSHHQSRGLRVEIVDVEDIYASYSGGVVGVEPIRDFVRDSVAQKGVQYVLLVGADTYDYKDHLGIGSVSFVPTPYTRTDFIVGYSPVDPLYGDVDGDLVPDVPVGRFPVRTPSELDDLVAKTLDYSQKLYSQTAVIAADRSDTGVSFANDARAFGDRLEGFEIRSAFIDHVGVDVARLTVTDAIEQGTALTVYFGHSGPTNWTFSGLFGIPDANALANYGKPTVVLQWGCWNTYHVEPSFNTLGHAFLMNQDRGAAAVLGSSTLLSTRAEQLMAHSLAPKLAEPGMTIGRAVTEARQELATHATLRLDAILGWTILGDPALTLQ